MPINYSALRTEIQNDPQSLGLVALVQTGSDQGIADALNLVRDGGAYQVFAGPFLPSQVFAQLDATELAALTALPLQRLQVVLALDLIDPRDTNTRTILGGLFGSGTNTRANLQSMSQRQGSRAEILFGSRTVITSSDVSFALRGVR